MAALRTVILRVKADIMAARVVTAARDMGRARAATAARAALMPTILPRCVQQRTILIMVIFRKH